MSISLRHRQLDSWIDRRVERSGLEINLCRMGINIVSKNTGLGEILQGEQQDWNTGSLGQSPGGAQSEEKEKKDCEVDGIIYAFEERKTGGTGLSTGGTNGSGPGTRVPKHKTQETEKNVGVQMESQDLW